MPTGPQGKAYTFVGGSDLMIFKSTEYPNEAWALLKFLSEDQTQKDYAQLLGMFPARLDPQQQVGQSSENHQAFFEAIVSFVQNPGDLDNILTNLDTVQADAYGG